MMAGPPNGPAQPFHPQHPHPTYMVPSISETGENPNPEMYNNPNMDPNSMVNGSSHDQKLNSMQHQGQHAQIDMHNMEGK